MKRTRTDGPSLHQALKLMKKHSLSVNPPFGSSCKYYIAAFTSVVVGDSLPAYIPGHQRNRTAPQRSQWLQSVLSLGPITEKNYQQQMHENYTFNLPKHPKQLIRTLINRFTSNYLTDPFTKQTKRWTDLQGNKIEKNNRRTIIY